MYYNFISDGHLLVNYHCGLACLNIAVFLRWQVETYNYTPTLHCVDVTKGTDKTCVMRHNTLKFCLLIWIKTHSTYYYKIQTHHRICSGLSSTAKSSFSKWSSGRGHVWWHPIWIIISTKDGRAHGDLKKISTSYGQGHQLPCWKGYPPQFQEVATVGAEVRHPENTGK